MNAPMDAPASKPPTLVPPSGSAFDRFLRLHAFELLIFVIMFVLLALCLAAAPLISDDTAPGAARHEPERLVL